MTSEPCSLAGRSGCHWFENWAGLWEVRATLASGIARVFFTMVENEAILLHGFIKKSQKTPLTELETARKRKRALETS